MSFNIRNIREISNDPLTKFANQLAKKMARFQLANATDKLENKEDVFSNAQDIDTVIRYNNLISSTRFDGNKLFYPPAEPDGDASLRLWILGHNQGNEIRDWSGEQRDGFLYGDPRLIDGTPFDDGTATGDTKSICLRFNRPGSDTENTDHLTVPYNIRHRASENISTGISFFMRFRVFDLVQQNGWNRTLYQKRDNSGSPPTDAIRVMVEDTSGKILVRYWNDGAQYNKRTTTGISINTVYDLWVTYTESGNIIKIYLNGVDMTLEDPGNSSDFGSPEDDFDWYIFKHGGGDETNGYVYGDLFDFRVYREKIVTQSDIGTSVLFDGTDDYIDLTNDATLWSQALTKFSFSCWIYPTAGWDGNDREVVNHGFASNQGFRCVIDTSVANKIRFTIKNAVGSTLTAFASTLTLNAWNHVVCVYDNSLGSANLKIYVNKVVGGTTGNLTESLNLSATMQLGQTSTDFKGNMKDFRWYTTRALTQTEINNIYNNSILAPTPDYWLKMNEETGNPLDNISSTKVGTLTNGTSWVTNDIGNMYTNKWTIAPIPFGQVMITNYYATGWTLGHGYTSTGYTDIGYDT